MQMCHLARICNLFNKKPLKNHHSPTTPPPKKKETKTKHNKIIIIWKSKLITKYHNRRKYICANLKLTSLVIQAQRLIFIVCLPFWLQPN